MEAKFLLFDKFSQFVILLDLHKNNKIFYDYTELYCQRQEYLQKYFFECFTIFFFRSSSINNKYFCEYRDNSSSNSKQLY